MKVMLVDRPICFACVDGSKAAPKSRESIFRADCGPSDAICEELCPSTANYDILVYFNLQPGINGISNTYKDWYKFLYVIILRRSYSYSFGILCLTRPRFKLLSKINYELARTGGLFN